MVRTRSTNDIILSLIDFIRTAQPLLDTKPGTVVRDVVIDGPSAQLSRLYDEIANVSSLQSLRLAVGSDLDKLAQNFGATRQNGNQAGGIAIMTFSNLSTSIAVSQGDIVTAKNGSSFSVVNGIVVTPTFESQYRAIASKYRADLDFIGSTDELAVEVVVQAVSAGQQGNISTYSLNNTNISGINFVTNSSPFSGGADVEDDATFRNRVLGIFSGANTGTSLGYQNAVLGDPSVIDALVIGPGNPLMTRDGTQVFVAEDGQRTIISDGTGGKVDIYVFGTRLQEVTDSYIYNDQSNTGDPTNSENDFVLGQVPGDEDKTVTRKRIDNLSTGILPSQPVNNVIQVSGSISGSNFVEKSVDELGRVSGNYEIIFDQGAYAGSPWGFDKLHWISDRISGFTEDKTKGIFNGQDPLAFSDVLEVSSAVQNISVSNENSRVIASDRSRIQLSHFPIKNVTRVFNLTTGERYIVANQNPDGSGSVNNTGVIQIRGNTLPAVSDTLQVDYTWIYSYDPYFDFDNIVFSNNARAVQDSVDWDMSNLVRREVATLISSGSFLTATVTHNVSSVISVNVFTEEVVDVTLINGELALVVSEPVSNVVSVTKSENGGHLWNTTANDGTFSGSVIFLPSDTIASLGDQVSVVYNAIDVFNGDVEGSFDANLISITPSASAVAGRLVECTYIADVNTVLPGTALSDLPAIRSQNEFDTETAVGVGTQPSTNLFLLGGGIYKNLRQGPTNLSMTISGAISPGVITASGTTIQAVFDVVFTTAFSGLKQNLSSAIKSFLGLSSVEQVPSNVKVARLVKMERVEASSDLQVLEVLNEYDIKNYSLNDNSLVLDESIADTSLSVTEVELPSTPNNLENAPVAGNALRARFYITTSIDSENVYFSKGGTLITNKKFVTVDTIAISSGFTSTSSSSASLVVRNFNQPNARSRYTAIYDYLAPKANERISIRYNSDRLITDSTLTVESVRPVTADVLVKAATPLPVDVTMNVVVTEAFVNSTAIVQQNVSDAIISTLNAQELGTIIDSSDLINAAYTVNGVDRVRVIYFNRANQEGSVLSIEAQENEYIISNDVVVNIETR
jgi:hypothetical protein